MIKKYFCILLSVLLLASCTPVPTTQADKATPPDPVAEETPVIPDFDNLNDQELLQYLEDEVYADLEASFLSDDFIIEGINAIYVSQEYIDELAYNSKTNVYFGFSLADLDAEFDGSRYVFSLGEDGTTIVEEFETYDNTKDQIVRNVSVGTGVILLCATVSVVSGGVAAPTVSVVFAVAAKTGITVALSSAAIGGIISAAVKGYETGDLEQSIKAAALGASEGFMWGAITGVVAGGITTAKSIKTASTATSKALKSGEILTPIQSEQRALMQYGGKEQVTYLAGKEVPYGTPGGTRPDVVRTVGGHIEAIEVKNYDLANNIGSLHTTMERQISTRVQNLPPGSTQRIVLDATGRGYSDEFLEGIVAGLRSRLDSVYPNIPIDIMR